MARYANARWRPFGWMNRLIKYNKTQVAVHITAGNGDPRTISSWIRGNAGANFVNYKGGVLDQLSDSRCKSAADYGAKHIISVECVGVWGPIDAGQVAALRKLFLDAHKYDGVPLRLARTSSDAGIGWHRLGVDGNFPSGRYGGRLQRSPRGIKTSGAFGKACPTEPVIDQVIAIVEELSGEGWEGAMGWGPLREGDRGRDVTEYQELLLALGYDLGDAGADGVFGPITTKATKKFQRKNKLARDGVVGERTQKALNTKDWFDMATKKDVRDVIDAGIEAFFSSDKGQKMIANAVWKKDVIGAPGDTDTKKNPTWRGDSFLRNIRWHARSGAAARAEKKLDKVLKRLDAQDAAMDALARSNGLDPAEVRTVLREAVEDRLRIEGEISLSDATAEQEEA